MKNLIASLLFFAILATVVAQSPAATNTSIAEYRNLLSEAQKIITQYKKLLVECQMQQEIETGLQAQQFQHQAEILIRAFKDLRDVNAALIKAHQQLIEAIIRILQERSTPLEKKTIR